MGPNRDKSAHRLNSASRRELAVGIAATLLFFFSALLIPVAGLMLAVFTPLPTLLAYYGKGRVAGWLVSGGTLFLGTLILFCLGMEEAAPYLAQMLLMGLLLGFGMRRHWPVELTIGSSALFLFGMGVVSLWLSYGGAGGEILKGIERDLRDAISMTFKHYGDPTPESRMLEQALLETVPFMVRLLPGAAFACALMASWLNVSITRRYCRIHNILLPPWAEWSKWKAPETLIWPVIACGFIAFFAVGTLKTLALNALVVLSVPYLFQGLSIISFYFDRWQLPRVFRAIIYGFILLQQFATMAAVLIGLFDMWFDFRRISGKYISNP